MGAIATCAVPRRVAPVMLCRFREGGQELGRTCSLGVPYDRHDALKNEAAYARHYKYMATMPLLHYTHLPLAESRNTYTLQTIIG